MKMVKKIMAVMLSITIAAGTFNLPVYAAESAEADGQSEESMESVLEETVERLTIKSQ